MSKRDKVKNVAQITKGKAEQAAGKKLGKPGLELDGKIDELKGNLKQAGEKVKDAFGK